MSARKRESAQGAAPAPRTARRLAWPGDPDGLTAADVDFEALAHVLANTCRFGGRTTQYHSLAAHAVVLSEEIEALEGLSGEDRRRLALHALIASAPSAWLRGEPAGSQRAAERGGWLGSGIERAVREAAGLAPVLAEEHAELLRFVVRMTDAAERRDLAGADAGEGVAFPPLKRRIRSHAPGRAARLWLARFRALATPPRGEGAGAAGRSNDGDSDGTRGQATKGTETGGGEAGQATA